jgi:uncharacterized damage-inducible protein DinB
MNANELFGHWHEVRFGLRQAFSGLDQKRLDYHPRKELRSIGEIVCHIAGCENGWFRYIVQHELKDWAEADFRPGDYPTLVQLDGLLAEVHARTEAFLETVDIKDVDQPVMLPWGPVVPLRWVIWHVLEHEIHHRGEIFLMLGLQGLEAPDI